MTKVALVDGDILIHESCFAAQSAYKQATGTDDIVGFESVENSMVQRIEQIMLGAGCDSYVLYITEGRTFRYDVAFTKPYKGTRNAEKPYHYSNLRAVIKNLYPCKVVTHLEADDQLAIDALADPDNTVLCSRDKDLRQVTGATVYSWELGNQPSFGPTKIPRIGSINAQGKGTGFTFFMAQMIAGDSADNIPGIAGKGSAYACKLLSPIVEDGELTDDEKVAAMKAAVTTAYQRCYSDDYEAVLKEQSTLLWMLRKAPTNQGGNDD
jgi:5'-3' exonuclease